MPRKRQAKPKFTGEQRQCRLSGCGAMFQVPLSAKNKEFCSTQHRQQFHSARRAEAFEALAKAEAGQGPGQEPQVEEKQP